MANTKTSIIAEQDLSRDLYEANSAYRNYYGQMNYTRAAGTDATAASYNDAISNAYMAGQRNKAAVAQSGYGAEGMRKLNGQLQTALMNAYDQYRSKYASDVNEINNSVDSGINEVATNLRSIGQELGSKQAQYQEGAFRYLEDLNRQGYFNNGGQFDTYDEYLAWKKDLRDKYQGSYENYMLEYDSLYDKGYDATGRYHAPIDREAFEAEDMNESYWRATWAKQQAFKGVFNNDGSLNEDKLKTAIFSELEDDGTMKLDDAGNPIITGDLNVRGIEMLDRLNALSPEDYDTYSSWLAKEDKDLYMWSVQRAMLGNGTNAAVAMQNLGADGVYSFMERFGGLTEEQTDKLFKEFEFDSERLTMKDAWTDSKSTKTGKDASAADVTNRNIEELTKSTKAITDLYQALDLNDALYKLTTEDGQEVNLNMTQMMTLQYAAALGIDPEEASKLLGTEEVVNKFKTDNANLGSQELKNLAIGLGVTAGAVGAAATGVVIAGISAWGASTIAAEAALTGTSFAATAAGAAGVAGWVPVVGWIVAGVALIAAGIASGFALHETRMESLENVKNANATEGQLRKQWNQWAVQSASVGYELRRKALGQA